MEAGDTTVQEMAAAAFNDIVRHALLIKEGRAFKAECGGLYHRAATSSKAESVRVRSALIRSAMIRN